MWAIYKVCSPLLRQECSFDPACLLNPTLRLLMKLHRRIRRCHIQDIFEERIDRVAGVLKTRNYCKIER